MRNRWWEIQDLLSALPLSQYRTAEQHETARLLRQHLAIHDVLDRRRSEEERPAPTPGDPAYWAQGLKITEINIEDKKATPWEKLGPAQRESLLAFIVSTEIEDAMSHAEGDNIVYDALGEHRILGKSRKKKGRILPATK